MPVSIFHDAAEVRLMSFLRQRSSWTIFAVLFTFEKINFPQEVRFQ